MTLNPSYVSTHRRSERGFTVLETLIAIAVMGVGISVFLSLYQLSLVFLESSRAERIAAHVAEEQMALVTAHPQSLDWTRLWSVPVGERSKVSTGFGTAEMPAAWPTVESAYYRTKNEYENCTWETYGRVPEADAAYVEVSVEVLWTFKNRDRRLVLTSMLPRAQIEGGS